MCIDSVVKWQEMMSAGLHAGSREALLNNNNVPCAAHWAHPSARHFQGFT